MCPVRRTHATSQVTHYPSDVATPAPSSLRSLPVLVTGASGFIGHHVATELLRRGAAVTVAVRDPARLPAVLAGGNARVLQVDGMRPGALAESIRAVRPACVFHLAGYGVAKHERDETAMQRLNADLLAELVDVLATDEHTDWPGLRLVHAGSAFEYGTLSEPLDESVQPQPFTPYGKSKLAGSEIVHRAVREHRLPALVLRPFTVFGHGERSGRLFPTLLAARDRDDPVPLSTGEQQRDFVLVQDVASAFVDLALADASAVVQRQGPFDRSTINLASGRLHRVRDFALAAADALGIARQRLQFGAIAQLPEEMPHLPVPVTRLRQALGHPLPGDLPALLARAVAGSASRV